MYNEQLRGRSLRLKRRTLKCACCDFPSFALRCELPSLAGDTPATLPSASKLFFAFSKMMCNCEVENSAKKHLFHHYHLRQIRAIASVASATRTKQNRRNSICAPILVEVKNVVASSWLAKPLSSKS